MWAAIAGAADPVTVETTDGGALRGTVVVAAEVHDVAELVRDPVRVGQLVDGDTTVKAQPDGSCHRVTTHTKHPIMPVTYVARGCPTDSGYLMELVQSAQLRKFRSVWTVQEVEGGTKVAFELEVRPTLPIPQGIVRRNSRNGVLDSLLAVRKHFGGAP